MLDELFAAARKESRQEASSDLLARVLSDAEAHQPKATDLVVTEVRRPSRWRQFIEVIGGWPSLTGLAAATVAGIWVGFSASTTMLPNGLSDLTGQNDEIYLTYLNAGEFIDDEDL